MASRDKLNVPSMDVTETVTYVKGNGTEQSPSQRPGKRMKLEAEQITTVPAVGVSVVIDNMTSSPPLVEQDLPVRPMDEVDGLFKEFKGTSSASLFHTKPLVDENVLPESNGSAGIPTDEANGDGGDDSDKENEKANEDKTTIIPPEGTDQSFGEVAHLKKTSGSGEYDGAATVPQVQNTARNKPEGVHRSEPLKATHVRFGNERPNVPSRPKNHNSIPAGSEANIALEVQASEHESEDDAPEAMTLSSGLEIARASAMDAAKAVERQQTATKKKRQERESRLKEQAKSSRKAKKRKFDDKLELNEQEDNSLFQSETLDQTVKLPTTKYTLPALLPDSILATEPVIRSPTPPSKPEIRKIKSKRHQFFEADEKLPKDIKRGPVNVRVLERNKSLLPPKVSKNSKTLRETWLSGRKGRNGNMVYERRKTGGGFLRR